MFRNVVLGKGRHPSRNLHLAAATYCGSIADMWHISTSELHELTSMPQAALNYGPRSWILPMAERDLATDRVQICKTWTDLLPNPDMNI